MKEQDKTPEEEISGDSQSTQERVQGSDYEDDQRTWKKKGCTEGEVRSFLTVRKYEEYNNREMKNTITEMKNTLEGINSRVNDMEGQIKELEDTVVEITDAKQ